MKMSLETRTKIFGKVCRLVETKHVDPAMNGVDWTALVRDHRDEILAAGESEIFERKVHTLEVTRAGRRLPTCSRPVPQATDPGVKLDKL